MKNMHISTTTLFGVLVFGTAAMAQEQEVVASKRPLNEIGDIFTFFHTPANLVQIQVANDKTLYAWQILSAFQYTMQIERDGPISVLPEKLDPKIGKVAFTRPDEKPTLPVSAAKKSFNQRLYGRRLQRRREIAVRCGRRVSRPTHRRTVHRLAGQGLMDWKPA